MGSRSDKKRRKPRRPIEHPPVIPYGERFHPRGGHAYRHEWVRFRERLDLGDTRYVARLLGVTVRSIQRWEYQGPAPAWYHAALLGLRDVWGVYPVPDP